VKRPSWLQSVLPYAAIFLVIAVISGPIYYYRILYPHTDDYSAHVIFTLRLLKRDLPPTFVLAHPLFELLTGFLYWLWRRQIGLFETAAVVQVLAQIAAAQVIYFYLGKLVRKGGEFLRVFLSISLTYAGPLMLLAVFDHKFYFGYIGLASYHNPTVHLLRPFALLSFIFATRAFSNPRNPFWVVLVSAAAMLAGMLTKPNYGIALLPALGVMALWFLIKKRPIDWRLLIGGQVIPFLIVLAFQWVLIYMLPDAEPAHIILAPFAVESYWSSFLPVKFILSILFPLAVLFLNWRQLRQNDEMLLAWLAFFISVIQLYFLAEAGDRFVHGNFRWGAQTALFVLIAASLRYLLHRQGPFKFERKDWPIYAAYLLQLAGGIAYYIYAFVQPGYG
jgi:hypothetical protein